MYPAATRHLQGPKAPSERYSLWCAIRGLGRRLLGWYRGRFDRHSSELHTVASAWLSLAEGVDDHAMSAALRRGAVSLLAHACDERARGPDGAAGAGGGLSGVW